MKHSTEQQCCKTCMYYFAFPEDDNVSGICVYDGHEQEEQPNHWCTGYRNGMLFPIESVQADKQEK